MASFFIYNSLVLLNKKAPPLAGLFVIPMGFEPMTTTLKV